MVRDFLSYRLKTTLKTMNKDSFWTSVFTVPEFNSYLNSYQLLQTKLCFSPYRLLPPPTQPPFKVSDWSLLINQTNLFTSIHAEKYILIKNIKQCWQRKTVISQTLDKSDIATFSRSIAKDLRMYKMSYYWYLLSAIATNAFIYLLIVRLPSGEIACVALSHWTLCSTFKYKGTSMILYSLFIFCQFHPIYLSSSLLNY